MTLFFVIATLLVIIALSILFPLFRQTGDVADVDQRDINIAIAREQQASLKLAHEAGEIDAVRYDSALRELEESLASDLANEQSQRHSGLKGRWSALVLVALFVPLTTAWLYREVGTPDALDPGFLERAARVAAERQAQAAGAATGAQAGDEQVPGLAELIPQLQQRLEAEPDDVEGWRILGRTLLLTGVFDEAVQALQRALEIDDQDTATLASAAEAIAMSREGDLQGQPVAYLEAALEIDPLHQPSRWLLAIARQQAGDHADAMRLFSDLRFEVQDDTEAVDSITQMMQRSERALAFADSSAADGNESPGGNGGGESDAAGTGDANASVAQLDGEAAGTASEDTPTGASPAVTVAVSLGDSVDADIDQALTVFIYARAVNGPPMPLAVARRSVSDLPVRLTLDESMAMVPTMSIGAFPEVTIGARISTSGDPIASAGDWFGEISPVLPGDQPEVAITIDQQVP